MAVKKFITANFYDEQVLFPAVKQVRKKGYKIQDVYTPFPIHGLDAAMGLRDTSLHTAGFIYGITGTLTAFSFITWAFTTDWPLNIGGKPFFALPAWIPYHVRAYGTVCGRRHGAYVLLLVPVGAVCKKRSLQSALYRRYVCDGD
jgi:hypothetical protein